MSTKQNEDKKVPENPIFDPFPKPVTMPTGWDLSGLVSDSVPVSSPQRASAPSTDDSADTSEK